MKLFHFFSLVDLQARMQLKAEASRLYLSYLWWVIEPLLFIAVFYFVWEVLLKSGRENFIFFLICGKIPFLWFSKSVQSASVSIVQNRGLIHQIDIPKFLFPYVAIQEALYRQWVVFLVLFSFTIFYGNLPEWNWLWLLPLICVQYGLIVLCSLIGAFLVSFVLDFKMLIGLGMMLLMFVSGVFWDINSISDANMRELVLNYNPIAFLLDAYRQILMEQSMYDLDHLMRLGGAVLLGLILTHIIFHESSKVLAERVINS